MIELAPLGEAGTLVTVSAAAGTETAEVARAMRRVRGAAIPGIVDVVPSPPALLVRFDPAMIARAGLEQAVLQAMSMPDVGDPRPAGLHELVVAYGGEDGADLAAAAQALAMSPEELVRRHAAGVYTVASTGFAPGFVYLDGLEPALRLPRRDRPRPRVPAGSVAIAEAYTGIYGGGTGGGWWLIGLTRALTFDPRADPPSAFALGDRVTFSPAA